jgi:hypothetical protein
LTVLCNACLEPKKITGKTFYIGKGYELDSNLDKSYDIAEDKILLRQKIILPHLVSENLNDPARGDLPSYFKLPKKPIVLPPKTAATVKQEEATPDYGWFHPLEMVRLTFSDEGISLLVPAIYVKDISDYIEQAKIDAKWNELIKTLRIGMDLFVAAFSLVATLANPGTALLRGLIFFGVLGVADATIVTFEEEIRNTKYGPEFLDAWDNFNGMVASMALFEAAGVVLSKGAKLLTTLKTAASREYVTAILMRVMLEINISNFTRGALEILNTEQVYNLVRPFVSTSEITRLQQAGVMFLSATKTTETAAETEMIVIYKTQIIAKGSEKKLNDIIKQLTKLSSNELLDELEKLASSSSVQFGEIAKFRKLNNLPEFIQSVDTTGTVAKVEIGKKTFFGISSKLSPKSLPLRRKWFELLNFNPPRKHLGNARFLSHAEAHALINAFEDIGYLPKKITIFVDRETCRWCVYEIHYLMKKMGIEELTIFNSIKANPNPRIIKLP